MPPILADLDTKSSDYLEELAEQYRQFKRTADRYDLKRCTDALKLIRIALQRRAQGITAEPE